MNELIKELLEQARVQDRGYFIYQDGNGIQTVEKAIDLDKFTDLLLEEVMQTLIITGHESAADELNNHFGIEE